jgi:hypothetical protein
MHSSFLSPLAEIIITCTSDDKGFANEVYDFLYSELDKQKQFEDGKKLEVKKEFINLIIEEDAENKNNNLYEIHIDDHAHIPKGMVNWILQSFLKSDPNRFKEYDVIEFDNTFTIGKVINLSNVEGVHTCEICGFFTPYEEELYTHRLTHFNVIG